MRPITFNAILTTSRKAAIPVKYNPRYPYPINGVSRPAVKRVGNDAVGTATSEDVHEGLLEDGGVGEGRGGHVGGGDGVWGLVGEG